MTQPALTALLPSSPQRPLRPQSAYSIELPKHRKPFIHTQDNYIPFHSPSAVPCKRPQSAVAKLKSNQVHPQPTTPRRERPQTASPRHQHVDTKARAAITPSVKVRPQSATTMYKGAKRPRPPSAWTLMQKQLKALGPLSRDGTIDFASVELTRKEIELQRDVTASARRKLGDIKQQHDEKQAALTAALVLLEQESSLENYVSASQTNTMLQLNTLETSLQYSKDQLNKANHYTRVLQHMLERLKLESHNYEMQSKRLALRAGVLEKEVRSLETRKLNQVNQVLKNTKTIEKLRIERNQALTHANCVLSHLHSEIDQSFELERRRIAADKKRTNLIMTFRTPENENKTTRLTRADTKLLLFREAMLSTKEKTFDQLVQETGESDVSLLISRFLSYPIDHRALEQMHEDGINATKSLEDKFAQLEKELREFQSCGIDEVVETQRRIKARLEEELWLARTQDENTLASCIMYKNVITSIDQSFNAILKLLYCIDIKANTPPTDTECIHELAKLTLQKVEQLVQEGPVLSTQDLQEILERLDISPRIATIPLNEKQDSAKFSNG